MPSFNTTNRNKLKIENFLFQLSLFLIPSNLAYHLYIQSAYINGRLVDYLLPKLYLSDIPILLFISLNLINNKKLIDLSKIKTKINNSKLVKLSLILALITVINSLVGTHWASSLWYLTKVIELALFGVITYQKYTKKQFDRLSFWPLIGAISLQTVVSLYQYINHKSLIGYIFLGEPDLTSVGIATTSNNGILEVMAHGTTPHPNVLAGFFVIASLLLLQSTHLDYEKRFKKTVKLLLISLTTIIIYLTKSITALSGAIFATTIKLEQNKISNKQGRLIVQIILGFTLILSLLIYPLNNHLKIMSDNPSFYERYELINASKEIITKNLLSGTGLNQFITKLPNYPLSKQQAYLLQPVHHGLLLILAETGILGLILIAIFLLSWLNLSKRHNAPNSAYLSASAIFLILLFDHYPLTLQTGQLLLLIALVYPLLKPKNT